MFTDYQGNEDEEDGIKYPYHNDTKTFPSNKGELSRLTVWYTYSAAIWSLLEYFRSGQAPRGSQH